MINVKHNPIIVFDGICNLCNSSVQFIIKRDHKKIFLFSSLQSDAAHDILLQFKLNNSDLDSIILIKNGKIYKKSTAIIEILRSLKGRWQLFYGLIIIPKFIRDYIYQIIAKNRYKWFGKRKFCMTPSKELEERFLI